ncbi:MAG: MFS transporter [Burkholderiales bacterium]
MRLPFFYGWAIVAIAFVTMAFGVNARTAFSLLFPPILAEFGWQRATAAGAFSFGFLVTAVFSPLLGKLMDRFGPRLAMELAVGVTGLGLVLAAFVSQPWHLYVTLGVLVGAGSTILGYTGHGLFLPNWFVRRRGLAMSIAFSGVGIGSILLLPAIQWAIEAHGWRATCVTMGVVVLAVLAPLNLLLRQRPQDLGLEPDGDLAPASGGLSKGDNVVDRAWAAVDWTLARAMRTARFWWVATGYFTALTAWYAVQVHQTKYLVEAGFSGTYAAWALGFVSLAGIPGQIALGHLSDRIGREWVWTVGCLGFAICYAALLAISAAPSAVLLWTMVIAQGFLGYGMTSVVGAIPAEIFQGRHYGGIFGTLMGGAVAGGAFGPWLFGLIYDLTGTYAAGFWIAIGACAYSALAIWMAAPRRVRAVAGRIAV